MKRRKYCDKALYDIFTPRSPPIHRQFTAAIFYQNFNDLVTYS